MDAPTLVAYGDDAGKTGLICTQQVHTPPPLRAHGEAGLQTTLRYLARVAAMAVTRGTTILRTHHYSDAAANGQESALVSPFQMHHSPHAHPASADGGDSPSTQLQKLGVCARRVVDLSKDGNKQRLEQACGGNGSKDSARTSMRTCLVRPQVTHRS